VRVNQESKVPTEQEVRQWYDNRYASRGEDSMRPASAYPIYLDDLRAQPGRTLLDIACGTGFFLRAAVQRGLKTWGVDISDEAVKVARRVSPESKIDVGKGEQLNFADASFDYVTCLGSLEHFLDMDQGVSEMKRVAKPDALFCIGVPNSDFLYWKVSGKYGTEQQDINEHMLSLREWSDFFVRNGLKIVRIRQDRWPMHKFRLFASANPLKTVKALAIRLAWSLLPLRYAYQFIFILTR
jgi:SAM-dependent methyltransferase